MKILIMLSENDWKFYSKVIHEKVWFLEELLRLMRVPLQAFKRISAHLQGHGTAFRHTIISSNEKMFYCDSGARIVKDL